MAFKKIGSISVDRDKISRENLGLYEKIISITDKTKRPVLIFLKLLELILMIDYLLKKVCQKFTKLNFACLPVALNSGTVWPKSGKLFSNKTITVSILNHIPSGLEPTNFKKRLEEELYLELDRIC